MTISRIMMWIGGALLAVVAVAMACFVYIVVVSRWYTDIRPIFFGKVITDPDDPRFDPMQFRFEYYSRRRGNTWDLPKALLKMFPPGTDKAYVDKILIDRAGAESGKAPQWKNAYAYHWPSFASLGGVAIGVYFDDSSKTTTFHLGGNRLYESEDYQASLSPGVREMIATGDKIMKEINDNLESKMRPIRKQYIGIEDGFLKKENRDVGK